MNTYIAIYAGKETQINAEGLYEAKLKGLIALNVPKSKYNLMSVTLVSVGDRAVVHSGASL